MKQEEFDLIVHEITEWKNIFVGSRKELPDPEGKDFSLDLVQSNKIWVVDRILETLVRLFPDESVGCELLPHLAKVEEASRSLCLQCGVKVIPGLNTDFCSLECEGENESENAARGIEGDS
jgi:hypothetical protein